MGTDRNALLPAEVKQRRLVGGSGGC
jgi:hypothetical protein